MSCPAYVVGSDPHRAGYCRRIRDWLRSQFSIKRIVGNRGSLPLSMLFVGWTVSRLTIPFLYTAVRLEADFNAGDGLVTTFLSFTESVTYIHEMQSIAKLEDAAVRVERLKHLAIPHLTRNGRIRGRFLLMLIAAAHVCASTSLSLWFGWPVFGK